MFGFDGCCCDNCTLWEQDFTAMEDGPVDAAKWGVVSGNWEVKDGALQTSDDDACINFLNVTPWESMALWLDVDVLASGADLWLYNGLSIFGAYNWVMTGGSPGYISEYSKTQNPMPIRLHEPFRLQAAWNVLPGPPSYGTRGYQLAIQYAEDDPDYWYGIDLDGYDATGGTYRKIISGFGSGALSGSTLRILKAKWIKNECAQPITAKALALTNFRAGADDGYYVTLQGFQGNLSELNDTYYVSSDTSGGWYPCSLTLDPPRCLIDRITISGGGLGLISIKAADNGDVFAWNPPHRNFRALNGDVCPVWPDMSMAMMTWYAAHWPSGPSSDYAGSTAIITSDPVWP